MLRLIVGALGAVPITLALFFLMRFLISTPPPKLDENLSTIKIEIARDVRDEETRVDESQQRPEQREAPPPPPKLTSSRRPPKQDSINVNIGDVGMSIDPSGDFRSDSDVQPIVRVNPQYPPRAAERGITGWVHLEFTVTETGTVEDVRVIDADPPSMFNRAAIRAVQKWKYKPMMVGGKPVRWKTEVVLTFNLEDD